MKKKWNQTLYLWEHNYKQHVWRGQIFFWDWDVNWGVSMCRRWRVLVGETGETSPRLRVPPLSFVNTPSSLLNRHVLYLKKILCSAKANTQRVDDQRLCFWSQQWNKKTHKVFKTKPWMSIMLKCLCHFNDWDFLIYSVAGAPVVTDEW